MKSLPSKWKSTSYHSLSASSSFHSHMDFNNFSFIRSPTFSSLNDEIFDLEDIAKHYKVKISDITLEKGKSNQAANRIIKKMVKGMGYFVEKEQECYFNGINSNKLTKLYTTTYNRLDVAIIYEDKEHKESVLCGFGAFFTLPLHSTKVGRGAC